MSQGHCRFICVRLSL